MNAPDREKALQLALAQIEKNHGKGSVMRLGDNTRPPVGIIPTGSIALDVALGVGGLPRGRVVEIYGPESSGKCLTADTYVWTDHGLETIAELFARCGQPASCTSRTTDVREQGHRLVNERGELEPLAVITHNNRKSTLRVVPRSGRAVTVTHNHPLRVMSERGFIVWRRAADIRVGDTLVSAAFGAVEAAASGDLSEDEAVLLGYLVAEGSLNDRYRVAFTNWDLEVGAEFTALARHVFGVDVRCYDGKEYRVPGRHVREMAFERYGLDYVTAAGKSVPACVRAAGHKAQRAFLSALFEGDGWIDQSSTVGLGTASEQLAREVQLLLYGLGVPATVSSSYNQKYERDYWTVTVNPASVAAFLEQVGFRSERRRAQIAKNFRPSARDPQLTSIPHLAGMIRDLRDDCGGDRELDEIVGDLLRPDMNLLCSRSRLQKLIAWCDGRVDRLPPTSIAILGHLRALAAHRYTYEPVVAIEDGGVQPTFDVMLPETHSFLANGVLSHNTTVALHAVANAQAAGGIAAFIDAEHALDPEYAKALGVNTDDLLVSQPDTGEQALEIADMLIRSGALDVIVIDSVAALVPRAEIEGEMGDSHVGLQARLMSQALRKITGALNNSGTTAIFINQLREKIGVMFGSPETTTGGRALKFYASVRLDVRRIETLKDGTDMVGNRTRVKVVKNKCLAEGSLVFDPVTGTAHRIEDIVGSQLDVHVAAADKHGVLHVRPVVNWFDQGEQEVIGLKLRDGTALWVTPDHQVLGERGWATAGELVRGDRIARPRRFLGFGEEQPISPEHARMVGYLIGDGYVGGETPVSFINVSAQLQEDAARIAAELGCRTTARKGGVEVSFSHRRGECNALLELCRSTGIWGKLAWEKTIPALFFAPGVASDVVANLLFGLLETDGWVGREQNGGIRVGYATTSEQLAHQIHWLLMRWGISSSVRRRDPRAQRGGIIHGRGISGKRPCWEVRISGIDNVSALVDAIPTWGPRGAALAAACGDSEGRDSEGRDSEGRLRGSQQVYLSTAVIEPVLAHLNDRGISAVDAARLIGDEAGDPRGGMRQVLGASRFRRDRLAQLADALDDAFLQSVVADQLSYAVIAEVLSPRRARTFDVEVDELHNLVVNDVVVHNCAPPFKQAEFDILYGVGISREGSLIDVGVEQSIIRKSGAWYTYEGDQLGQGKENARKFLRENPDVAAEIEKRIKEKLGIGAVLDAAVEPLPAPVDF